MPILQIFPSNGPKEVAISIPKYSRSSERTFLPSTPAGISACISGTQKCISAPSGSALITYNEDIEKIILARKHVEKGIRTAEDMETMLPHIPSNYLDLAQLQDYWGPRHLNHHTESTSMQYAVHEAFLFSHSIIYLPG